MCCVDDDTDLADLCDAVIYVLAEGVPQDQLRKLRDSVQIASWRVQPPDRSTWGLSPEQQAQAARLMGQAG